MSQLRDGEGQCGALAPSAGSLVVTVDSGGGGSLTAAMATRLVAARAVAMATHPVSWLRPMPTCPCDVTSGIAR